MKKLVVILLCSIGLLQTGLGQNTKDYPHLCVQVTGRWHQEPCFTSREQNVFYDIDDEFLDSIAPKNVIELQPYFASLELDKKYDRISAEIQKSKK